MTFEIKHVTLDGQPIVKLRCPGCGVWAEIDDDQYHGRVSTECESVGCSFHETHDYSAPP